MTNVSERGIWVLSGAILEFAHDGNFDLVRSILQSFLTDTQNRIECLEQALGSDPDAVERISHSLKGVFRQLGLPELGAAAEKLEQGSRAEMDTAALAVLVRGLIDRWGEAKQSVISTRDSLPTNNRPEA